MIFLKTVKTALIFFFFSTILLGVIYPLFTYLVGTTFFHHKANGSLIIENKKVIGSALIGQKFSSEKYFHSRPSRSVAPYDPLVSAGANYGPTSRKLYELIEQDITNYKNENNISENSLPIDAITSSCSGLDPDISMQNALLQAPRVAKARNITNEQVLKLIKKNRHKKFLGILGEERINVLKLNIALDKHDF